MTVSVWKLFQSYNDQILYRICRGNQRRYERFIRRAAQLILNEESEEEEYKNDEALNMDDPHPFGGIEDVFADILSLGPKIQHSDFEEQSMGLHQNICGAYENLLSIAMNIKRQRTRRMAMRPKIQLTIRDFYE